MLQNHFNTKFFIKKAIYQQKPLRKTDLYQHVFHKFDLLPKQPSGMGPNATRDVPDTAVLILFLYCLHIVRILFLYCGYKNNMRTICKQYKNNIRYAVSDTSHPPPGWGDATGCFFTLRLAFSVFSSYVCSRKTAPSYSEDIE